VLDGLVVQGAGKLRGWLMQRRSPVGWRRWVPVALVLAACVFICAPLWQRSPLSYDHATHLFKAWHFWHEMLGQGRLRGWSNFWAFGFPSEELVPFGESVWVCLWRVLTLGQLSWTRTYALAFAALLTFKAFSAFWFARRYFGAIAGVACAWFVLIDPGAMLKGGWRWHTHYGVWPVELSMCLVLLAFLELEKVFEQRKARVVLVAGLWFCASLLSHQIALLVFLMTAPLLLLEHYLRPLVPPFSAFAQAAGALLLGLALAAFSVVPFVVHSGHAQDLGWLGDSLPVVSKNLLELRTFENVWFPIHALALIGAWFALRERRPGAVFVVSAAAVFTIFSSDALISWLHLERALPTLIKIEWDRFMVPGRLFWYALAGHALGQLWRLTARGPSPLSRGRRWLAWGVGLVLGGLLVVPGLGDFYHTQVKKQFRGEPELQYWQDFQELFAWSSTLEKAPGELLRIGYHFPFGNHLPTLAPVFDGLPMYKIGYTPTQIFDEFPNTDEPELLARLSIKYLVSPYPLERPDLTLERRFGELYLYRCNSYDPRPFHLLGPGEAELLEFAPEQVRLRLSGTSAESRVVVHVAAYERWRASQGGVELPIATVPVYGVEYPMLMELPARDGELRLDYVYGRSEWLGLGITLSALPVFFGLVWLGRRGTALERVLAALARARTPLVVGALGLVVLAAALLAERTRDRRRLLPPDSLFHATKGLELTLDSAPCIKTEPLTFDCGDQRLGVEVLPGVWGIHSCLSTSSAGELRVRGPLPLGSFIAGRYDPRKEGSGTIELSVAGHSLGQTRTRAHSLRQQLIRFDTRAYAGTSPEVDLRVTGAALYCFDFRLIP
jgi:hypothetical protein